MEEKVYIRAIILLLDYRQVAQSDYYDIKWKFPQFGMGIKNNDQFGIQYCVFFYFYQWKIELLLKILILFLWVN